MTVTNFVYPPNARELPRRESPIKPPQGYAVMRSGVCYSTSTTHPAAGASPHPSGTDPTHTGTT